MTTPCPRSADLLRLLDGETTRNEEALLAAHLDACAACRTERANLRQLFEDVRQPLDGVPSTGSAERVMALVRSGRASPGLPGGPRRYAWPAAIGLMAAAGLAVVVSTGIVHRPGGGPAFQARSVASNRGLDRLAGVKVYAPLSSGQALHEGAIVSPQTPFTATYTNLSEQEAVHLMVFAVDAQDDVHWLYPTYVEDTVDPAAVRLPIAKSETTLPDSVVLENPAAGPMRVVSILSPVPLRVSMIETLTHDQLDRIALSRRWPSAVVDETHITMKSSERTR